MSFPWKQVEKHLHEHRKDLGWKQSPCVRLALKSGERYYVYRTLESNDDFFAALVYVNEETIDETPRFHYVAMGPDQIGYMEAFEPEPRRPEHLKRFSFATTSGAKSEKVERTERMDKSKIADEK